MRVWARKCKRGKMPATENAVVATPREEQVFAFDVPLDASAELAAEHIDGLTPDGFFPWQMIVWPGAGVRVFCRRSKASKPGELAEAKRRAAEVTRKAKDAEDAQADIALADIVAASPRITAGVARVRLGRLGYRRGNDWMRDAMARVMRR